MRLADWAMLVCLVCGSITPAHASTVDVLSIDSGTKVISTKKKHGAAALRSPISFSETVPYGADAGTPFALGALKLTKKTFGKKVTILNLSVKGEAQGNSFSMDLAYQFRRGAGPGCTKSARACSRMIRITPLASGPVSVVSGDQLVTIQADGFVSELGGSAATLFLPTKKRGKRSPTSMLLQGSVVVSPILTDPAPVPVPATGLLLLGGMGAVGAMCRKRRKMTI
jgi:hypothetical protein